MDFRCCGNSEGATLLVPDGKSLPTLSVARGQESQGAGGMEWSGHFRHGVLESLLKVANVSN